MAIKTFRDIWKFPLSYDDLDSVMDAHGIVVFDFKNCGVPEFTRTAIVLCVSEEFGTTVYSPGSLRLNEEAEILYLKKSGEEVKVINLKGWAHLTGTLELTAKDASKYQNEFGSYIIETLTGE